MGISYHQLILKLRMEKAAALIKQQSASVEAIASAVGYSTVSSFYRAFTKYYGTTPVVYMKKAEA
jgi:AraC-like DNA-binding protein